jgi:hypothetical protein
MKKWIWTLYPVLVAIFIVFSLNYGLNDADKWQKFFSQRNLADEQEQKAARLQTRLKTLQGFDLNQGNADLSDLILTFPAARRVWALISEVNSAASDSGVIVEKYSAVVGDVKEASGAATAAKSELPMKLSVDLTLDTMGQLWTVLDRLENSLPLVKIDSVEYLSTKATLVVEGAWGSWSRVASDITNPLPEYASALTDVKKRTNGFKAFTQIVDLNMAGTGSGVINPF